MVFCFFKRFTHKKICATALENENIWSPDFLKILPKDFLKDWKYCKSYLEYFEMGLSLDPVQFFSMFMFLSIIIE